MKISTFYSKLKIKTALLVSGMFLTFSSGQINFAGSNLSAQVLLDQHSLANGASTWNITTTHNNEIIILSVGGYTWGYIQMDCAPGNVTVNGLNATYLNKGEWLNQNFQWTCSIWAYVAPTPGTYVCHATEVGFVSPFYFNYATSVYQNCALGLNLGNIIVGGVDSNQTLTTISAPITTTIAGSFIYGTANNNDNGGTGTVVWNTISLLDWNYINNGIDGSQAGATMPAGTYNIVTTDIGASNVWMTEALIAVQPNPNCCILSTTATDSINVSCFGGTNGVAVANPSNGHGAYTYLWSPGGQTTDIITGLSAGTYTIVVNDTGACGATATVTITQPALPLTSSIVPTNIICNGGTGSALVTAAGGTVPYTYSWSTVPAQTNANATALSAGNYTVVVTDNNGCQSTSTTAITQPAAMGVTISGPAMICVGSSGNFTATVTGGSVPYTYSWSNGGATTNPASVNYDPSQNYSVTVTDANGCSETAQITVVSGPLLTVAITGPNSSCAGMTSTLCATAIGGTGGNSFLWQPGNITSPCITVSPTSTTTYTISVLDNCATLATASATININPSPAVSFFADVNQGCAPLCIQLHNTTLIGGNGAQYLWSFGNGDTVHSSNPIYCYSSGGNYSVTLTVTSDSGCSSTLQKINMVTVFTHPDASFIPSPQITSIISPTVQFTDKSTDAYGIAYWFWNFGDGTTSSGSNVENPSHTYQDTGTFCANLVVMNMNGCTDTTIKCVVISPEFSLYIPSAFSPNGDGLNDVFIPVGNYMKSFEMYIYDRWGSLLFHSTDANNGWNGTVHGSSAIAQEDIYVYKILATDSQNNQHSYTGSLTLVK